MVQSRYRRGGLAALAIFFALLSMVGIAAAAPKDGTAGKSTAAPGHNKDGGTAAADTSPTASASAADTQSQAATSTSKSSSDQVCDGDPSGKSASGNGANTDGTNNDYHHNCGADSANGSGGGNATGRPCAGCVGNADDKNPPGQYKNGSDANSGYECDVKGQPNGGNNGVGKGNPAHTPCTPQTPTCPDGSTLPASGKCPTPKCPDGSTIPANGKCPGNKCPDGSTLPANGKCPSNKCPDGSTMPTSGQCPTNKCPDGSTMPTSGQCPTTNTCPDGSVMPASGTCGGGGGTTVAGVTLGRPTEVLGAEITRGAGLAFTGASSLAPMLVTALGLLGLGFGAVGATHRRREDDFIHCADRLRGHV
ncbi:MAG: hypothetical protein QOF60_422 [Actinomycetota bacterium]|nr:hypothetical protein [Actinomycetota bacterium]